MWDVDRKRCVCVGGVSQGVKENSVISAQFFCKHKADLKYEVYFLKKFNLLKKSETSASFD